MEKIKIKLTEKDMKDMATVYEELILTVKSRLSKKIFTNDKFGVIVIQAVMNLVCSLSIIMAITKKELLDAVSNIWDERERLNAGPLN